MIRPRALPRLAPLGIAAALALIAAPAGATPNFPSAIASHLGLATSPDCTLCHVGPTQIGTVVTPFGTSMRARGLVMYDEKSLTTALDALAAEKKDSDGDGTPDIDELRAGTDPNTAGDGTGGTGTPAPDEPRYGCGAHVAPSTRGPGAVASLAFAAVFTALARRRAPHP
jgi:hypothetical protein